MKMKRAVTLFLCIIMIIYIFAGPAIFKRYAVDYRKSYEPKPNEPEWKGIIRFWDYPNLDTTTGSRFGWIEKRIREFEKKNPGVYVEFRPLDIQNGRTTLMAAAKIGAYPDIAPVGSDWFFISSGLLDALDEYITDANKNDLDKEALESISYRGNVYGIPWAARGYTLLLNKRIFEQRGAELPKDGQWTYEEFVDSLKKLTHKGDRKGTGSTYGLNGYINPGCYNLTGILMSDGAQFIDSSGNYTFNSPIALKGLQKLYELKHKHGVTHPQFGEMSKGQAFSTFLSGKCGVLLADAWMVQYIKNIGSQYGIDFTVAAYPSGEAELPVYMNDIYYSYGVFKQEDPLKRKVCAELINYITDESFTQDLTKFGYFSPRKSGSLIYDKDDAMYAINRGLSYAENLPRHKNWQEIDAVIQYNIKEVLNSGKSPEKALEDMKTQVNKYFSYQND
ncbi:ABC transporter substrate-binding protein [Lutispora saccharofermentans]|uniref:Extracellular solute-binding protein n=1 Tax=Lutispora saccharofermentans TaxID=3024236 RepID=A0ABT1NJZ2_9FIRM|nr:extracellular solute-binding protein [Lutispora saccharofermentans]MCQ1531569.1 extracellular solute-binding protein [Lutispora saccharofermentans]